MKKLSEIAALPQLVRITIDDAELVAQYGAGEPIEFWVYDRQPLEMFMRLATLRPENTSDLIAAVSELILDENGDRVISEGRVLPMPLLTAAAERVSTFLGN